MRVSYAFRVPVLFLSILAFPTLVSADPAVSTDCTILSIDNIGHERLDALEKSLDLWLEMDSILFACDDSSSLLQARANLAPGSGGSYWQQVPIDRLLVARSSHPGTSEGFTDAKVLTRGGPYRVLLADDAAAAQRLLHPHDSPDEEHSCLRTVTMPMDQSRILARQSANQAPRPTTRFGSSAGEAADAVDGARWMADVETLAGWNRHTHGSQIAQARDWLVTQMNGIGLTTSTESFQVGGTTAYNVIGRLDGTTRPDDWFLVGAHYDSTSQNTSAAAPGAEDNASGCAGVLEMARVLVPRQPEATVFFICFSGEEQGLHGSDDHAGALVAAGDGPKLKRVLTMDMIGYTGDSDLDVLLETTPAFASTLDALVDAAAMFTTLRSVTTLNAFGSDHIPYLNRNLPAQLTIENDWDSYPSYHRTSDTADNLSLDMGHQTLRMNAAVLAEEAGAGSAAAGSIFTDGFDSGDVSAWSSTSP